MRESEARFRALTQLSSDWYWEQDAQFRFTRVDGNLKDANALPTENYVAMTRWNSGANCTRTRRTRRRPEASACAKPGSRAAC